MMGRLAAQDEYGFSDLGVPVGGRVEEPPAKQGRGVMGALAETWPARLAKEAWNAVKLPGDVAQGKVPMYGDDGRTNPEVIGRAADLGGLVMGGAYAAPAMKDVSGMGIRAYHSSPHEFERFDFSPTKMRTGEGATAYMEGGYFGSSPDVSGRGGFYDQKFTARNLDKRDLNQAEANVLRMMGDGYSEMNILREMASRGGTTFDEAQAIIDKMSKAKSHIYEVDIKTDPAKLLDWDRRFKTPDEMEAFAAKFDAVSPTMRNALEDWSYKSQKRGIPLPDGSDIIREFGGVEGTKSRQLARTFQDAGIPGLKYFDQGSRLPRSVTDLETRIAKANDQLAVWNKLPNDRTQPMMVKSFNEELADLHGQLAAAKATPQSQNYVMFPGSEHLVDITKRYGLAGAAPAGMGALASQGDYQLQPEERL